MMDDDEHTANCIVCGKPATRWAGHVHMGSRVFTAGWCSEMCENKSEGKACAEFSSGCYGDWKLGDGKRGPPFRAKPSLPGGDLSYQYRLNHILQNQIDVLECEISRLESRIVKLEGEKR